MAIISSIRMRIYSGLKTKTAYYITSMRLMTSLLKVRSQIMRKRERINHVSGKMSTMLIWTPMDSGWKMM